MLDRVSAPLAGGSNESGPGNGTALVPETGANPGSGTGDDNDWFVEVATGIYGKEAGYQLHLATGWPRTSCYAFVANDPDARRKIPTAFLHRVFNLPIGKPFYDAFMRGCTAQWWRDDERARRIGVCVIEVTNND